MSNQLHTPGPWEIRVEFGKLCIRPSNYRQKGYTGGYGPIAKVIGDKRLNSNEADARLIAAAPVLLAALEALIPHVLHYASMPSAHADAHKDAAASLAAVAKATEKD